MSRAWLRAAELAALTALGIGALVVIAFMVKLDRSPEAVGMMIGVVPLVLSAISRIGQSQAMQSMADSLARSQPVIGEEDGR